jgi:hypothetical protein
MTEKDFHLMFLKDTGYRAEKYPQMYFKWLERKMIDIYESFKIIITKL